MCFWDIIVDVIWRWLAWRWRDLACLAAKAMAAAGWLTWLAW